MNLALKIPKSRLTLDEFFALPDDPEGTRYELIDGELRAMSPASAAHGLIQGHLTGALRSLFRERASSCRAVTEGSVVPRLNSRANIRVPDILVTCSNIRQGQMTFDDPILIVEILSPTNEIDTRDNVRDYATIPSVREIFLVNSTRIEAELFRKSGDGAWPSKPHIFSAGEQIALQSVDLIFTLDEVYSGSYLAP